MANPAKQIPELSEKNKRNFFKKVSTIPTKDGCLEWMASKKRMGYGAFGVGGKTFKSHRIAYFIATGNDPKEFQIRHSCHNPSCNNPDHLSIGTSQDNMDDKVRAGRVAKQKGECHGQAKLKESQIIEIRADNRPHREIALNYGVSRPHISYIKSRKKWAHVD